MTRPLVMVGGGVAAILGAGFIALLLVGTEGERGGRLDAPGEQRATGQSADGVPADGDTVPDIEPPNAIARQASDWGIERCAREIALVSEFLTRNQVFSARSMRGPSDPDGEMFSSTIVARPPDAGTQSLSTMSVAPVSAGRCNVVYETTAHFAADCEAVRSAQFASFVEPIELGGLARAYATAAGDGQLYMLPTNGGCLVKKTQALY